MPRRASTIGLSSHPSTDPATPLRSLRRYLGIDGGGGVSGTSWSAGLADPFINPSTLQSFSHPPPSPITQVFGEPCLAIYMSFLAAFGVAETIMIIIGTSSRRVEVDGREEEKRRERGGGETVAFVQ